MDDMVRETVKFLAEEGGERHKDSLIGRENQNEMKREV